MGYFGRFDLAAHFRYPHISRRMLERIDARYLGGGGVWREAVSQLVSLSELTRIFGRIDHA